MISSLGASIYLIPLDLVLFVWYLIERCIFCWYFIMIKFDKYLVCFKLLSSFASYIFSFINSSHSDREFFKIKFSFVCRVFIFLYIIFMFFCSYESINGEYYLSKLYNLAVSCCSFFVFDVFVANSYFISFQIERWTIAISRVGDHGNWFPSLVTIPSGFNMLEIRSSWVYLLIWSLGKWWYYDQV